MGSPGRKPYHERTDIEKLESQWKKTKSLHGKNQASAAVVRAATAAEIAANIAIRSEFKTHTDFDAKTVDGFLLWANGLNGKMQQLVLPLVFQGNAKNSTFKTLKTLASDINKLRNQIVHSGNYANDDETIELCTKAQKFVELLVGRYRSNYRLPNITRTVSSSDSSGSDSGR